MSKEIRIAGRLVRVPAGYIQAEAEFTRNEDAVFAALPDGPEKEKARAAVCAKRLDFYYLWLAGEADLPTPNPKPKSFWHKLSRWLRGHPLEK